MKISELKECNTLIVKKDQDVIGTLVRTDQGAAFTYEKEYLIKNSSSDIFASASFTLPLRSTSYQVHGDNLLPFFANLLPEGLRLSAIVKGLKTSTSDLFSLLAATGVNTIGDISAYPENELPTLKTPEIFLDSPPRSFIELFKKSISTTDYASRIADESVPGVQPKLSGKMISFAVGMKKRRRDYLLKLTPEEYPRLVENEYFFMQLAKTCDISTAATELIHDKEKQSALLVERFDRYFDQETKTVKKLHQEDGCQLLDRYPQDKYRLSCREIADAVQTYTHAPILEITKLLQLWAFSYIIGNGDHHAKNTSLLITQDKKIILSPAYDLLSTIPYGDTKMALLFEGRNDYIKRKDFMQFAARYGIKDKALTIVLDSLIKKISPWIPRIIEIGFPKKKSDFLIAIMKKRVSDLS